MLSTQCPSQFWRAVGSLTSWRLLSFDGFHRGIFTTVSGTMVEIGPEVAQVLDGMVCTIGELVESAEEIGDIALDLAHGTKSQKAAAKADLRGDYRRFRVHLEGLKNDLPHLFRHYTETEMQNQTVLAV